MAKQIPPAYTTALARRGFNIENWHAGGGFGNVYKALQVGLGRHVAIKFFDNIVQRQNPTSEKRFEREAPLLARIQHPAIPFVITQGEVHDGSEKTPYTIMQFIPGDTLAEHLSASQRPLADPTIWRVMSDLLGALDAVHQHGIVHRDVNPRNIILSPYGTYLVDFSIGFSTNPEPGLTRATEANTRIGTMNYMAPEQIADSSTVNHLVDVYAAGVVLGEMFGARLPLRVDVLDVELTNVAKPVRDLIRRAAADKPTDRFQRASEFKAELAKAMGSENMPASRHASEDELSDNDVAVIGLVLESSPFPDDNLPRHALMEALREHMTAVERSFAIHRALNKSLIERTWETEDDFHGEGEKYCAVKLTAEGQQWAERHQDWIARVLGMPAARRASLGADDDIPF
ncbi:MAG: serine/threonine-protein kinase [Myxococcota bacterium]